MRPTTGFALAFLLACTAGTAQSPGRDLAPLPPTPPPLVSVAPGDVPVVVSEARVRIEPGAGIARTRIELQLHNPGRRLLEGHLQFPLRPGQQVVGFALDIDGQMREAVPVGKARGREVFEAIERREVDPGLLEQTEGEFFRLRVYPFPPGGMRRVHIDLLEPLRNEDQGWGMDLPLHFAAGLDQVVVEVHSASAPRFEGLLGPAPRLGSQAGRHELILPARAFDPARGIGLRFARAGGPRIQRQSHDGQAWMLAEVPVRGGSAPRRVPQRIGLLWDSSMSGARRAHDLEFALLDAYFRAAGEVRVDLIRLRDAPEAVQRHQVRGGDWRALRRELESTVYDGATNPGGWTPDPAVGEYLLFGDGLFNYGTDPFPAFGPDQRLFTVQAGTDGDSVRLAALAHARGGDAIRLRDSRDLEGARSALLRDPPRLLAIEGVDLRELVAESPVVRDGMLRVAGRITGPAPRLRLRLLADGREQAIELALDRAEDGGLAAMQWARLQLAALRADPLRNRAAIGELGKRFGLVTPETSLLVLEQVEDYVRYDIPPPPALRDQFDRLRAAGLAERGQTRQARTERAAAAWAERVAWWERDFPKDRAPAVHEIAATSHRQDAEQRRRQAIPAPGMAAPPAPMAPASESLDRVTVTGSRAAPGRPEDYGSGPEADAERGGGTTSISLAPWQPDAPYARRMRLATAGEAYAVYLDERSRQAPGTAFHLDAADILFERGEPALALRVLSNLAEMDLDNRHVLRVLGYRLVQAGRADLAVAVFERVLGMGEEEPQSFRDLALALAAVGERQRAVELLHEVVVGDWDGRFPDIDMTALAELNALVATSPEPLDTRAIDPRLLRNLPLDLRAVLSWDSDNSDMDLWVTDPTGERAFYGNRLTRQGGRMSQDFTGGYGPEEFALRTAIPGTYRIEANFFGDRQQVVTGPTTLSLWLLTGFGTPAQREERVTLRLAERRETILVGEFQVGAASAR